MARVSSPVTKSESSPVMKRNPRPKLYASAAERMAAHRARNSTLEFRADNKTAETVTKIADTIDVSRSDLLLSMTKFALTNHDWARFGLTHKTLPKYEGNPMATKEKKIFMMAMGADKPKVPEFYDFEFTHYIPINSYGGSSVAFKFVGHNLDGDLVVSEPESGKKVGQVTNYEKIKSGKTDRQLAKQVIENLLMRVGADKVYSVLKKG